MPEPLEVMGGIGHDNHIGCFGDVYDTLRRLIEPCDLNNIKKVYEIIYSPKIRTESKDFFFNFTSFINFVKTQLVDKNKIDAFVDRINLEYILETEWDYCKRWLNSIGSFNFFEKNFKHNGEILQIIDLETKETISYSKNMGIY